MSETKFELDDALSKYVTKPDPIGKPELVMLYSPPGGGKGLVYGTPVATPKGWVPVESLKVGDFVMGSDGKPTRVFGIWDRGKQETFVVDFSDGARVTTDGDHLWQVANHKDVSYVTDTRSIMRRQDSTHPKFYAIPIVEPVQFDTRAKLPLPPYMLGALLADGYLAGVVVQYTKNDLNVVQAVQRSAETGGFRLTEVTSASSTARQWKVLETVRIREVLDSLGLRVLSGYKHVPEMYLTATVDERWELLNGLFDGDGSYRKDRETAQYTTSSPQLADDVLQLCWSLGISAQKNYVIGDETWKITVLSGHNPFKFCDHASKSLSGHSYYRRRITSVTPNGTAKTRCIAVEAADRLFVTKDFIVTHNTHTAAGSINLPGATKILYFDCEGSTVGVLSNFDVSKFDVIRLDQMDNAIPVFDAFIKRLGKEDTGYSAVVVDTLDVLQDMKLKQLESKGVDGWDKWGQLAEWSTTVARTLKKAKTLGILVVHEREEKSDSGAVLSRLRVSGSAKDTLPGIPDLIMYLERKIDTGEDSDGKEHTYGFVASSDRKVTKNRFGLPPVIKDVTLKGLWSFIDNKSKEK